MDRRTFTAGLAAGAAVVAAAPALRGQARAKGTSSGNLTGYVYDDRYKDHIIYDGHPESPERLVKIQQAMAETGLAPRVTPVAPMDHSMAALESHLRKVHTPSHLQGVDAIATTGEVARLAVAGVLAAVKAVNDGAVRNAFCAIRPPGHHAHNIGGEEGFCYYSNVAVAAKYAQSLGHERILIIDWDYHHGNGTQDVFYTDGSVLFFSTHDYQAYPGTGNPALTGEGDGDGLNINVHLGCGAPDSSMIEAWDTRLLPAARAFQPDFVLISAGFDSRQGDTLGCLNITDSCFAEITRKAMAIAEEFAGGRLVSALEGGYNVDGVASAVTTHVGVLLDHEVRARSYTPSRAAAEAASPVVHDGVLHLPRSFRNCVTSVRVYDSHGRESSRGKRVQLAGSLVDLRAALNVPGIYTVMIERNDGAVIPVPCAGVR